MSYASSTGSDGSDLSSHPEPLPVETYFINMRLENFSPIVWRQLQVSSDITLLDLHNYIQRCMGWRNCHCWTFSLFKGVPSLQAPVNDFYGQFAGRVRTIDDEEQAYNGAAERVLLSQYLRECGEIIKYQYDYGDNWQVEIKLLDHFKEEPAEKVTCIAGARQGPPDDVGGTEGFSEFVEAMRQGSGEAYEQYAANYKISSFDFNWFDREQLTRWMRTKVEFVSDLDNWGPK